MEALPLVPKSGRCGRRPEMIPERTKFMGKKKRHGDNQLMITRHKERRYTFEYRDPLAGSNR